MILRSVAAQGDQKKRSAELDNLDSIAATCRPD